MADDNQGEMPQNNDGGAGGETHAPTFETWLQGQSDEIKGLITTHTAGLKSALDSERNQRKDLARALKDATKDLETGTEARKALEGLTAKLEDQEKQLAFYDAATSAGVSNLRLAWIAAREAGAVDKAGNVNMETLKKEYPELFKKAPPPPGNAGAGANGQQLPGQRTAGMDALIRQVAGVRQGE